MRYQQNLAGRRIAVVILTELRWSLVRRRLAEIAEAVNESIPASFTEVEIKS